MKSKIIFALIVLAVLGTGFLYVSDMGPEIKNLESMKKPSLGQRGSEHMLVIRIKGNPNEIWQDVFKELHKIYARLDGTQGHPLSCPRARVYKTDANGQAETEFGIPIPSNITRLPLVYDSVYLAEIKDWEYGPVGEILHVGPYKDEGKSIDILKAKIAGEGYWMKGSIEREYIKGPGKIFPRSENEYATLLRYSIYR